MTVEALLTIRNLIQIFQFMRTRGHDTYGELSKKFLSIIKCQFIILQVYVHQTAFLHPAEQYLIRKVIFDFGLNDAR